MKQKKYITVAVIATLFLLASFGFAVMRQPASTRALTTVTNPFASVPSPLLKGSDFDCKGCNVVIVGMTNVRRDHMGLYGYSRDTTPKIDAFAKRSVVYENAFSLTSWTLPVVASILTSLYPFQHGVMSRYGDFSKLGDAVITLADILKQNGYRTATFTGGFDLLPKYGITSRFDENYYPEAKTDYVFSNNNPLSNYGSFGFSVPKAIEWISGHKDKPFFAYVQGFDAHCPFSVPQKNEIFAKGLTSTIDFGQCYWTFDETTPLKVGGKNVYSLLTSVPTVAAVGSSEPTLVLPGAPMMAGNLPSHPTLVPSGAPQSVADFPSQLMTEEDLQYMTALYDGEINLVDGYVGTLLDSMEREGLLENTMVILLAEHGDMFGKYGRFMRGGPLRGTYYDDVLHVPLAIYFPKNRLQGIHRPQIMELTDLAPTILDALSLESPSQFVGHSAREISTSDAPGSQEAFAGSMFFPGSALFFSNITLISALRTPDWKLIYEDIFKSIPGLDTKPLSNFLNPAKEDIEVRTKLFDMRNDPEELTDVSARHPTIVDSLRKKMDQRIKGSQ